jgi:ketosteroid isomerase-like protein
MTAQTGRAASTSAHTDGVVVMRTSARRGDRSFADVLEVHVYRFRDGRVTEWRQAFDDQYAVDAVLG